MVLRISELFQGALGVALDTVNTSATGFSGTGTAVFDATIVADGTTSAQFTGAASLRLAQWTLTSQTVGYFSVYFTPQAIPAANLIFLRVGTTSTVSAFTGNIQTTGKVKLGDNSGTIVESVTTDSVVLGELNRIDVTYNAGAIHMEFYPGNAQANNAVGTATAGNTKTGTTTATSYAYRAVGIGTSTTLTLNVDAFREDDTALPGPVGAVATPTPLAAALLETDTVTAAPVSALAATLTATPSSGTVPFTVTATAGTTGGTGTAKSYAWAWGDGATTVAGAAASATHSYTTAGTYTATVTVTASGSTAATATASVQANAATGTQYLYMRSGATLVRARLGMRTGTTVTYLSP